MPPPHRRASPASPGRSAIERLGRHSSPAMEAAFCSADRVTLAGSMTSGLHESSSLAEVTFSRIEPLAARRPAPARHPRTGVDGGSTWSAPRAPGRRSLAPVARRRQASWPLSAPPTCPDEGGAASGDGCPPRWPPAGERASSDAVLLLLQLDLVAAPTLTTATPPESLASRSCSFLTVQSESVSSISRLICADAPLDVSLGAGAVDDCRLVLGEAISAGPPELVERSVLELEADLLGDDGRTGQGGDVAEHGLRRSPKPGAFTPQRRTDPGYGSRRGWRGPLRRTSSADASRGRPDA